MVGSTILNYVYLCKLKEWEKEVKREISDCVRECRDKVKDELLAECNEKGALILQEYERALYDIFYEGNYLICVKIMNMGIKIGMEIQQGFEELSD